MFGRKSRAEKLREQAESNSLVPIATLAAAYAGAKPVIERLLYDDDLRDNIRTFVEVGPLHSRPALRGRNPPTSSPNCGRTISSAPRSRPRRGPPARAASDTGGEGPRARRAGRSPAVPRPCSGRRLPVPSPEDRTPGPQVRHGHLRVSDLRRIGAEKNERFARSAGVTGPGRQASGKDARPRGRMPALQHPLLRMRRRKRGGREVRLRPLFWRALRGWRHSRSESRPSPAGRLSSAAAQPARKVRRASLAYSRMADAASEIMARSGSAPFDGRKAGRAGAWRLQERTVA